MKTPKPERKKRKAVAAIIRNKLIPLHKSFTKMHSRYKLALTAPIKPDVWIEQGGIIAPESYGKDGQAGVSIPSDAPMVLKDWSEIKKHIVIERVR